MWKVVSSYVLSMPDGFVKAKLQLNEAVAGRRQYQRWSACIQGLMAPMDMTIGRMFVDAHFDENTKSTVWWSFRCGYTGNRSGKIKLRTRFPLCNLFPPRPPAKILHINCFQFLLGVINDPWETENEPFAKFMGDKQIRMANVKVAYRKLKQRWRRWGWKHQKKQ